MKSRILSARVHVLNKCRERFSAVSKTVTMREHLLILFCCCLLITATASESNVSMLKADNNKVWNSDHFEKHKNTVKYNTTYDYWNVENVERKSTPIQRRQAFDVNSVQGEGDQYDSDEVTDEDVPSNNRSRDGMYVGAPCDSSCDGRLHHVSCDQTTRTCNCDRNYPVILSEYKGCGKPKQLGEQCFYHETCKYNDENALCVQVSHNALCQCAPGYHSVAYTKPMKRVFCTEDLAALSSDLPTLLGVTTGIAVLAGLICMVLHLFSKTKYPRHRNLADANIPPPIMYSSDTGVSLTAPFGHSSSRSSLHSAGSIGSYGSRRHSNNVLQSGSKGVLVSASRTGSRRPSLASIYSTNSSIRNYGVIRLEKEIQQKEIRQEMKLRLAKLQQQPYINQKPPEVLINRSPQRATITRMTVQTVSPMTPNSLDELLPLADESQESVVDHG